MKRGLANMLLIAACAAQLLVLAGMIASAERTLETGNEWRFRTAPRDPVDPFRGRYARLTFPVVTVPVEGDSLTQGDRVFARIQADEEGFAQLSVLSSRRPEGPDYLELSVLQTSGNRASVQLPFDRFYMDEERAPEVDRLMAGRRRAAWALVRVHEGRGVVADIHIEEPEETPDLERSMLAVWPANAELPDSLLPGIQEEVDSMWGSACRDERACLLAEVDLDDRVDQEWVLAIGPRIGSYLYLTPQSIREGEAPAWTFEHMRQTRGKLPRSVDEMIDALDRHGASGELAPRRLFRLGEGRLRTGP